MLLLMGSQDAGKVAAAEVARELADQTAAELRAQVLARHRAEWNPVRALLYRGIHERNVDVVRLAKIAGETLQLVQVGETRSWGLNEAARGADAAGVIVVIDRDDEADATGDV
ncbi:hypothetical protein HQ945_08820 [Phyllobacterium sp. BT25]|uniref:Uncharacterized protein n=1 Tax=Phyllobacterium pellucidum TaxID=2740464 RepID=A0A849VMI5_9HYPH|nr:hypothetical protein [Phyllobacterium pellucidum]NTS31355.1 hypothetical protein [Phyllobacterium pellucidum]